METNIYTNLDSFIKALASNFVSVIIYKTISLFEVIWHMDHAMHIVKAVPQGTG